MDFEDDSFGDMPPAPGDAPSAAYSPATQQDPPRDPHGVVDTRGSISFDGITIPHPQMAHRPQVAMSSPPPQGGSNVLGLSLVAVTGGAAIGWHLGGPYGALAGLLFGGAATNLLTAGYQVTRGTPDADRDAAVRAFYGIGAAGAGAYLLYKTGSRNE